MSFAVYVLDWAGALMGKGVWVRMYWHEAADAYRDVVDGAGLPIARRRDGWSFLVADPGDVDVLDRLTLGGEIVLERMAGRLVDAARMMRTYDAAEDLGPRTVAAHAHHEALMGDGAEGDPDEAICSRMGMDAATWRVVGAAQTAMAASRPRTCDNRDD